MDMDYTPVESADLNVTARMRQITAKDSIKKKK